MIMHLMYLKNPSQTKLNFIMVEPVSSRDITLAAGTLDELKRIVIAQISQFDSNSNGEYSKKAREEAAALKLQWPAYINKVIQHQICLRSEDASRICWDDGYGDKLHHLAGKIDNGIDKLPAGLGGIAAKAVMLATKVATGKSSKRLGGCSVCGGTKKFNPYEKRQLGRAGVVNDLTK